jgi:hypothetical protein
MTPRNEEAPMEKRQAIISLRRSWAQRAGIERLLPPSSSDAQTLTVRVFDYSLSDSVFVEIKLCPAVLAESWVRVFVPKTEIVTIIEAQDSADMERIIGFSESEGEAQVSAWSHPDGWIRF